MSATGSRFREPQIGIGTGRDALRIRIEADADEELGDACQLNEPDPFGFFGLAMLNVGMWVTLGLAGSLQATHYDTLDRGRPDPHRFRPAGNYFTFNSRMSSVPTILR